MNDAINVKFPLSTEHKSVVHDYLDQFVFTKENGDYSYQFWGKGQKAWNRTFATGGTYTMKALMWYHHIHKPKSKEYRARTIMKNLCLIVFGEKQKK